MSVLEQFDYGYMRNIQLVEQESPQPQRRRWVIVWHKGAFMERVSRRMTDENRARERFKAECRKAEKNTRRYL